MLAVGRNEDAIRSYIRQQEKKDAWLDLLNLWCRHQLQVVPKSGPRQRPRTAASSGSSRNAPGFAGGYLLPNSLTHRPDANSIYPLIPLPSRASATAALIPAALW